MTIRQLREMLAMLDPDAEAFVAFFYADGTHETFAIEDVTAHNGDAHIEIYAEEPAA